MDAFRNDCRILGSFDKYLYESGFAERHIPEYIVNGWTQTLYETNTAKSVADKLGYLRNFLKYLRYNGIQVFIPVNPKIADDYVPYLFSDDEMQRIFHAADTLTHGKSTTGLQIPMILRMLYGCGLRIAYTEIMLPPHAPPEYADRSTLWNAVEKIEKSRNSQLAREIEIAIPHKLPHDRQIALVG